MNVLIAYATTEGQTRKIAEWAARHIRRRGHPIELYDSADPISNLNLGSAMKSFHDQEFAIASYADAIDLEQFAG